MNDQSTPDTDPEYQASMTDTQVVQRLKDWAESHLPQSSYECFIEHLADAYEGIRPHEPHSNVWDLDIC